MENETIALSRTDIDDIVKDVRASVQAIEKGLKLKQNASFIPIELEKAMNLNLEEMEQLKTLSDKVVQKINQ